MIYSIKSHQIHNKGWILISKNPYDYFNKLRKGYFKNAPIINERNIMQMKIEKEWFYKNVANQRDESFTFYDDHIEYNGTIQKFGMLLKKSIEISNKINHLKIGF